MARNILYGILNWGLGHATRSSVLIKEYIEKGDHVIIASDGEASMLLKENFPECEFLTLNSYSPIYPEKGKNMALKMSMQIPKFLKAIKKENAFVKKYCKEKKVDIIISDNRYGFYHKEIHSVLLCHQLTMHVPQSKVLEKQFNEAYFKFLEKFNEHWVPDQESPENLSGKLGIHEKLTPKYIGILSRLKHSRVEKTFDLCVLLSGPEPQRTLLEEKVKRILPEIEGKKVLVKGVVSEKCIKTEKKHWIEYNYLNGELLNEVLNASKFIISRSGYSTIMDLVKLNKPALLIPTPGQTEQEYLAKYLDSKEQFTFSNQQQLNIKIITKALHQS